MLLFLVCLCGPRRPHIECNRPYARHRIKIFAYTSRGLTPEAALGASKIILSETIASAICFTDGKQVLASWGEDSAKCPAGTPVVLKTTLSVIETGEQSVFSRDTSHETGGYFPVCAPALSRRLPCAGIAWAHSNCTIPA